MGYYSAIKRNEVMIHITTCMNLKIIMLSKRRQTQKVTYCMIGHLGGGAQESDVLDL